MSFSKYMYTLVAILSYTDNQDKNIGILNLSVDSVVEVVHAVQVKQHNSCFIVC